MIIAQVFWIVSFFTYILEIAVRLPCPISAYLGTRINYIFGHLASSAQYCRIMSRCMGSVGSYFIATATRK